MGGEPVVRPIRVAIVDDHPVVVAGVRAWLDSDRSAVIETVLTTDRIELLTAPGAPVIDVALVDLNLRGELVLDAVARLCAGGQRVVVFSQHADHETVLAVLRAGACDFLAKHEAREHCVATIVAAASDRPYVTPSLAGAMAADVGPEAPRLSEQERTALLLWFQSMSKAAVAARMNITEYTVRQYIDRARVKYAKAGRAAPTKAALLARAIEDGIVTAAEIGEHHSMVQSWHP